MPDLFGSLTPFPGGLSGGFGQLGNFLPVAHGGGQSPGCRRPHLCAVSENEPRQGELFDVEATTADQVYGGMEREDFLSRKAVRDTDGEMILFRGNPIFAVYHSCCGGKTESPEYLWPGNFPYLKTMECPYCLGSPYFVWNYQVDGVRMRSALNSMNSLGSRIVGLRLGQRSESQRILQVSGSRGKRPGGSERTRLPSPPGPGSSPFHQFHGQGKRRRFLVCRARVGGMAPAFANGG